MRLVIGGLSDTIGRAAKKKAKDMGKIDGKKVTMARLFEYLYQEKFGKVPMTDPDDVLDCFKDDGGK